MGSEWNGMETSVRSGWNGMKTRYMYIREYLCHHSLP